MWEKIKEYLTEGQSLNSPFDKGVALDLVAMLTILSDESKWCKGMMYDGDKCDLWGAYYKLKNPSMFTPQVLASRLYSDDLFKRMEIVNKKIPDWVKIIIKWNDHPDRTYQEVILMLGKTIKELDPKLFKTLDKLYKNL